MKSIKERLKPELWEEELLGLLLRHAVTPEVVETPRIGEPTEEEITGPHLQIVLARRIVREIRVQIKQGLNIGIFSVGPGLHTLLTAKRSFILAFVTHDYGIPIRYFPEEQVLFWRNF